MMTLVLSKVPLGLRGHLTKWLLEVSSGVFVGNVSARVRDHLWEIVLEASDGGTALLIYSARNEQGFEIRNSGHAWKPIDIDGFITLRRPPASDLTGRTVKLPMSKAARYRWIHVQALKEAGNRDGPEGK